MPNKNIHVFLPILAVLHFLALYAKSFHFSLIAGPSPLYTSFSLTSLTSLAASSHDFLFAALWVPGEPNFAALLSFTI